MSDMEVVPLDPAKLHQASAAYSRAFLDYPQFICYYPSREWRNRYLQSICEVGLKFTLRYGEVYTNQDLKGVIGWLPPRRIRFTTWKYLTTAGMFNKVLLVGWKNLPRVFASENYAAKVHEEVMPGPHWFLWGLAVDPDCQGRGMGTRLMQPGLKRADEQGLPIYLETHEEKNVSYYQKRGFELVRSERVPKINLPFWCMVHEPEAG